MRKPELYQKWKDYKFENLQVDELTLAKCIKIIIFQTKKLILKHKKKIKIKLLPKPKLFLLNIQFIIDLCLDDNLAR